MIRYFIKHYSTFCDRIIIYDDQSTDLTRDIVGGFAELRECPWVGLDDIRSIELATTTYKEARGEADWVIWVDADEFIYHPDLPGMLAWLKDVGVTLPSVEGYSMISTSPPSGSGQIYDEIKTGFLDTSYAKHCVFDPQIDITWSAGKHQVAGGPFVTNSNDPLKLLHYRYLGPEWHLARNSRNYERVTPENKMRHHGMETYPGYEGHHSPAWYAEQISRAKVCV